MFLTTGQCVPLQAVDHETVLVLVVWLMGLVLLGSHIGITTILVKLVDTLPVHLGPSIAVLFRHRVGGGNHIDLVGEVVLGFNKLRDADQFPLVAHIHHLLGLDHHIEIYLRPQEDDPRRLSAMVVDPTFYHVWVVPKVAEVLIEVISLMMNDCHLAKIDVFNAIMEDEEGVERSSRLPQDLVRGGP